VLTWTGDDAFELGGIEFVCRALKAGFPSTPERMLLVKSRWQAEWYEQFLRHLRPQSVVEVGTFDGASLAMCAEIAQPQRLVGVDLRSEPSSALAAYIERRGLEDRVRPYYGVDQIDAARLNEILDGEFGDEQVDLVVDDASHALGATQRTFDILFPRVKPGGVYLLEDWPTHRLPQITDPLAPLVFELVLACSESPDAVAAVEVNRNYVVVRRGEHALETGTFALADCYGARERALLAEEGQAPMA
jgi:hypothetical protein